MKKYHPKVRSPFAERKSSQHKKHRVGNDDRNAGLVEHIKIWPAPKFASARRERGMIVSPSTVKESSRYPEHHLVARKPL